MNNRESGGTLISLVCVIAIALACAGEDGSNAPSSPPETASSEAQQPPPVAPASNQKLDPIRVSASHPAAGETVRVLHRKAPDPAMSLGYTWRLNGATVGSDVELVVPNKARRGDELEVTVVAQVGRVVSEPVKAMVEIENSPPVWVSLGISPAEAVIPGVMLTAHPEGADRDGDAVQFEYEWHLNGRAIRGANQKTFTPERVRRGDRVQAVVRMTDGDSSWEPRTSDEILIANRPPRIVSMPPNSWSGDRFEYQLRVEDADGDSRMQYKLVEGPSKMSVGSFDGRVTWNIPLSDRSTHAVEIAVTDGHGGEARQRFEIGARGAKSSSSPASPSR